MKKISLFIVALSTIFFVSCEADDKVVDQVIDGTTSGPALRVRSITGGTFNALVLDSEFTAQLELQADKPEMLTSMDVYISYQDNADDGVDNNKAETLLTTVDAGTFGTSERGLPEYVFAQTLADAAAALGLVQTNFAGGDSFTFRYAINFSDGTTWSTGDVNSNVAGGSYFSSPYSTVVGVNCILPGDYTLEMFDSYGDGWNGATITITIDGTGTDYFIEDGSAETVVINVPDGTTELAFAFTSLGDWPSEITYTLTAPSGASFSDGPDPSLGAIPLDLCP